MILFLSCGELSERKEIEYVANSDKKGQTFLNGNNTSEDYYPKGSFIEVVPSGLRLWKDVRLFQDDKEFNPKPFYLEDEMTILYDSLTNGEYQIKFISHFNDEIEKKISLVDSLKIKFPEDLKEYYSEISFNDFSVKELNPKDTLQILFQHFGCFSSDHQLIEYEFGKRDTKVKVADWGNNWEELNLNEPIDSLNKLIKEGRKYNGITGCSNYDIYTFRKKGKNEIARIEDGSCEWNGIRILIKKENWH